MRASVLFLALLTSISSASAQTNCPTSAPLAGSFIISSCGSFAGHCPAGAVNLAVVPNTGGRCPYPMGGCGVPPPPYSVQSCDTVTFHFDDGSPDQTLTGGTTVTHTYGTKGLYHPSVRIANARGAASTSMPLVITPDPPAVVSLAEHFPIVPENAGSVTMTLLRSGNLSVASTVNWMTMCTQCGALQPGSGSVTFGPGQTTKTFTLLIHDDQVWSGGNTFDDVYVTATDGTMFDPGTSLTWATIQIVDNDPQPVASIDDVTVRESGGRAHFTIRLSAPLGLDTSIAAYAEDGTARANIDYIPPARTTFIDFPPGATEESFDIPIIDNDKPEADKTFTVTIYGWTGALPAIGHGTATCTILNDDFLAPATLQVRAGQSALLRFEAGRPFAAATTIHVTASDPSTVGVPAFITVPAGSATGTIDVAGLRAGTATVGVQFGTAASQATIVVFDPAGIAVDPPALTLHAGDDGVVKLSITPAAAVTKFLAVTSSDPTLLEVPASVAIPPGATAEVRVHALRADRGAIDVSDPASGAMARIAVDVLGAAAPLVTAIAPAFGPAAGGTRVTLSGSHFDPPCALSFGSVAGTNVEGAGSVLRVTAPPHAEGSVDLVLTCRSGQVTLPNAFTYATPRRRAAR